MSTPPTSSRRRTFDLPKSSPDAGLAEWTSKIKAIQQEVDRDEEAEQRRLQDEITRSRMERARRRNTATGSVDWTAKRAMSPSSEASEDTYAISDRQQHQSDALRRLAGSASPHPPLDSPGAAASKAALGTKQEGISLAAFIGGRATGPRLNKPAPQQDAHNPALFDQTRREGPHPIFGRPNEGITTGGRLASLGVQKTPSVETGKHEDVKGVADTKTRELISSSQEGSGKATKTPPEVATKPTIYRKPSNQTMHSSDATLETGRAAPQVPAKPIILHKTSSHSIHTPDVPVDPLPSQIQIRTPPEIPTKPILPHNNSQSTVPPLSDTAHQSPASYAKTKASSLAEIMGGRAPGPRLNKQVSPEGVGEPVEGSVSSRYGLGVQGRALPGMTDTRSSSSPPQTLTSVISASSNPQISYKQDINRDESPNANVYPQRSFSGSKVVTASLARPIQPRPIAQPSPIAAASTTASPAFLRAPPSTQDLHPSLSRLQGRGFVEKRVKASAEIYEGSDIQQRERSTSAGSPGRRPTVLDRWQPIVPSPASPSPPTSPTPNKLTNKGKTTEVGENLFTSHLIPVQQVIRPRTTSPALGKAKPPMFDEARQELAPPVRLPGMTSPTSTPHKQWSQHRSPDENRVADDRPVVGNSAERDLREMGSKPLSHPTRDRARKPRKVPGSSHPTTRTKSPQRHMSEPGSEVNLRKDSEKVEGGSALDVKSLERVPSPEIRRKVTTSAESNINRLKNELTYQGPSKAILVARPSDLDPSNSVSSTLATDRRPLPGMATPSPTPIAPRPVTPTSPMSSPEEAPMSPSRHSRIPSTGQRATVMDVAQALQQHEQHIRESSLTPEPDVIESSANTLPSTANPEPEEVARTDVKAAITGWGRNVSPGVQPSERRRSLYDRYSVVTLPPLVEEKTPVPTPEGTLTRSFAQPDETAHNFHPNPHDWPPPNTAEGPTGIHVESTTRTPIESTTAIRTEIDSGIPMEIQTVVDVAVEQAIRLEHQDRPPPGFNLQLLLKDIPYSPNPREQTISVEVLLISGHTAAAITREPNVFYDSEVVAVVHRAKDKTSGLVSTKVWAWRGKDAELGDREERKVLELAGRFGTKGVHCVQGSEPHDLIHVLGGVLAIRQGKRMHWTAENTAMHRVHRFGDSIFVDEIDLAIINLCSAYSYCVSVLDAIYVWHGRGSSEDERKVASAYGQSLATETMKVTEFNEGEEDEMFWMMLGDDSFANASHWKFKHQLDRTGARLYTIDSTRPKAPVQLLPIFSGKNMPNDGIFVVDCRLEVFVIVTPPARGKRTDIQLALFLAENISAATANKRPFDPPVHIVILPSRLPLELQAAIRLCDEAELNGGAIPDHMNLLPLSEALDHMQRRSWPISTLSDINFLPLGVDPHML